MNPRLQRAALLIDQDRTELAEKELAAVLAEDPENPAAHSFKAMCLLERERYDDAVEAAERGAALGPNRPFSFYVLSLAWLRRRHYDKAQSFINEAISLDPEDADYRAFSGKIACVQQQWEDALESADAALAIDPEHVEALNLRAEALRKLGRSDDAQPQLQEALRLNPDCSETHASLGWNYLDQGERRKAEEHFREALRLDPESEWARLGVVETIRTYNPLYRPLFRYFQWMQSLGGRGRWIVIIGAYVIFRLMKTVADTNPALQIWLFPLIIAYVFFALTTWIGQPLIDVTLRFHPFGKLALSGDERAASNWVGGFFLGAVLSVIAALFISSVFWMWMLFFLLMLLPLSLMFNAEKPQPRKMLAFYTFALGACGLLGLMLLSIVPAPPEGAKTIPPLRLLAGLMFFAFIIGGVGASWIGNIMRSITWKK